MTDLERIFTRGWLDSTISTFTFGYWPYVEPIVDATQVVDWCVSDAPLYRWRVEDELLYRWTLSDVSREC